MPYCVVYYNRCIFESRVSFFLFPVCIPTPKSEFDLVGFVYPFQAKLEARTNELRTYEQTSLDVLKAVQQKWKKAHKEELLKHETEISELKKKVEEERTAWATERAALRKELEDVRAQQQKVPENDAVEDLERQLESAKKKVEALEKQKKESDLASAAKIKQLHDENADVLTANRELQAKLEEKEKRLRTNWEILVSHQSIITNHQKSFLKAESCAVFILSFRHAYSNGFLSL